MRLYALLTATAAGNYTLVRRLHCNIDECYRVGGSGGNNCSAAAAIVVGSGGMAVTEEQRRWNLERRRSMAPVRQVQYHGHYTCVSVGCYMYTLRARVFIYLFVPMCVCV